MNYPTPIEQTLTKLSNLTQIQLPWYGYRGDLSSPPQDITTWEIPQPNDRGYLIWERGGKVQWFAQIITIPPVLNGYSLGGLSLRLALTWWADSAQVYVNGKLVREGDLFDSSTRLLLCESVTPDEEIAIAIRLVSPQHDIGALMHSKYIYEKDQDPGFIATQWAILAEYIQQFAPLQLPILANHLSQIDWNLVTNSTEFDSQLQRISAQLLPLADQLKQYQIHLLGHAHLDLAWLWRVSETWQIAQNTFTSVLSLQERFPDLTFGHTSAALYQWIEQNRPDLFTAIQAKVKQGRWEILGGMWVEPEVNLVGGESLIRQLLYGQLYFQEKFGTITQIAWLPDSFGFPIQLPQILQQAGINYFLTGKLHWNDTSKFPYGWFRWQSLDGSSVLTLMLPPNVAGVMDTNPISMSNHVFSWFKQTNLTDSFWIPGVGDHGGGPTQEMLEVQQRWSQSSFFPTMTFSTALEYLQKLPRENLPVWDDELYLEFHRGCYTTHADQKYLNRYCETLLYEAELFLSLESVIQAQGQFSQQDITTAWQKVLFNQFHDILPGTSIPEVFQDAQQYWQQAINIGEQIRNQSLEAIASRILLPKPPHPDAKAIIIFNSLNWSRSEVVSIPLPDRQWTISNLEGDTLITQITSDRKLLFLTSPIPSVGYRLFWLYPIRETPLETPPSQYILDNGQISVEISPKTGDIISIFDQVNQKEILTAPGNQLQFFQDQGQYWDAWNIDPDYQNYPLPGTQLQKIEYLQAGPLQWSIRVTRTTDKSIWEQEYILRINSPILYIRTTVDWQEEHVLVKAAFPLNLESDRVIYGTACGAIARSTQQNTKWEVSALGWACLTDVEQNYSLSLLSNYKYGYDSQPNQLRLTLLRSSTWPDPQADRGRHQFTYAIYPYPGDWQNTECDKKVQQLNSPLHIIEYPPKGKTPDLQPMGSFVTLGADNLILLALKQGEVGKWILRCYECQGKSAYLNFQSDLGLEIVQRVNLLEEPLDIEEPLFIQPWQIASFLLNPHDPHRDHLD